ncbi:hypothetical protein F5X68DRAFT_227988 [Plectosphaerella plurivora]|uniref:Uncharacterized protein n=1 Tax=Plectosphaerella plurivora TaxID=936078 RepID=A0A9P9AFF6_9PEZI|nr:hypothetical protein F5X68DRAFT_227988 [Plectosphaerella plurivora]
MKLLLAEHPFLSYAVSHWAYHVRHADACDEDLHSRLQYFFDQHIRSWIHACVVLAGLRGITRTARHIKAYARKRNSGLSLSADDLDFFHLWSVDLIRIVGKFGRNLTQKPSSIYRIVPPMCPHGSMMYKTYSLESTMRVRGISSHGWDDYLARLPVGKETSLLKILCTVTYFICLVAIGAEIIVSQSETCEEIRRMAHGEYVREMEVNRSGSLLVTAGIDTFRVWGLSTGEELHRIP